MTLVTTALVLTLSLGGTKPAAAPTGSKLEQGQRAFASGDFKTALEAFDAAVAEGPDLATLEKLQLLRAQCFAAQQAFAKAEDAFAAALEANPDATLDPSRVDPALVKMLDGMRARLGGTLVVSSTPPGAAIILDGRRMGPAPMTFACGIGHRTVEAQWPEGPPVTLELQVHPRRESFIVLAQAPAPEPKVVEVKPQPPVPLPPTPSRVRPLADVRAMVDVLGARIPPEGGLEFGAGVELPWSRVSLSARVFPQFHLIPRAAVVVPLVERPDSVLNCAGFLELEVPIMFRSYGLGVGAGAAVGLEWRPTAWVAPFVQVGGRYLFMNDGNNIDTRFTVAGGTRLRLP